jgi:hypothetical protein
MAAQLHHTDMLRPHHAQQLQPHAQHALRDNSRHDTSGAKHATRDACCLTKTATLTQQILRQLCTSAVQRTQYCWQATAAARAKHAEGPARYNKHAAAADAVHSCHVYCSGSVRTEGCACAFPVEMHTTRRTLYAASELGSAIFQAKTHTARSPRPCRCTGCGHVAPTRVVHNSPPPGTAAVRPYAGPLRLHSRMAGPSTPTKCRLRQQRGLLTDAVEHT